MITSRQINKLIQETHLCLYISGIDVKTKYNQRIYKARTIEGQLQAWNNGVGKWFDIPPNAKFIDGRTGKTIN